MKPTLRLNRLRKELVLLLGTKVSPEESSGLPWAILRKLVEDHKENLGTTYGVLQDILTSRDVSRYFDLQSLNDPTAYGSSAAAYRSAAAVLSFLKKYPFGEVAGLDPLGKAIRRSDEAEMLCRQTNRRLRWFRHRGFRLEKKRPGLHAILHRARLLISSWLGSVDLNTIYNHTRHGPGGALGVSGSRTTGYYKYSAQTYTVSTRAVPYAIAAILADDQWRRYIIARSNLHGPWCSEADEGYYKALASLEVTSYNKVTYVPKTAQTHRAIAVEPLMNVYLQLGCGQYIRDKLRRAGFDLSDQTRNQKLARLGSQWEGLPSRCPSTLDLSMASDTLAVELVRELLPEDWFNLLSDLRSENGLRDGKEVPWSKFSSMGNGFTFELETLIFAALCISIARENRESSDGISVYGDDIIVPANLTLRVVEVLNYVGFRVNTEKSFAFGPFRESCGKDWFRGEDVRPFFLRKKIQTRRDLLLCHNSFFVRSAEGPDSEVVKFIFNRFPALVRDNLRGPVSEDTEGHLFSLWDSAQTSRLVQWDSGLQQWSYPSLKDSPLEFRGESEAVFLQLRDSLKNSVPVTELPEDSLSFWLQSFGRGEPKDVLAPLSKVPLRYRTQVARLVRHLGGDSSSNAAVVTRRKATRVRLATLTSNGWRND